MLSVHLKAVANPDSGQRFLPTPERVVPVPDLTEAVAACRRYIHQFDLGGGNWAGGQVFDVRGKQVARISYNGRVWDPETDKEIILSPAAAPESERKTSGSSGPGCGM